MKWHSVTDLAATQHGVVSRNQLLALGMSARTVSRLRDDHGWVRVHPGVYRLPGATPSFSQDAAAAQLALGVPSVITGLSAAHLYGVRPAPTVIDLLIDEHCRVTPPSGTRLRRTRTLLKPDSATVGTLQVAIGVRMVIDAAAYSPVEELRSLLIDARQRRLLELSTLAERLKTIGPVRGRGVLKQLTWELDEVRCDSVLEATVRRVLRDAGLPQPAAAPVAVRLPDRTLHVDIGWPDTKVGIEVDGFAYHSTRSDLERDHRRLNRLTLAGWSVLRVGWARVERDRETFIAEVRQLLTRKLVT